MKANMLRGVALAGVAAVVLSTGLLQRTTAQRASPAPSGALASRSEAVTPFKINVPEADLADLKQRLSRARIPDEIDGANWDYGTNRAYLRELVAYWRDRFDW